MLSQEKMISSVREFANAAHGSQKRKYSDDPYIVHPMRVMETCRNYAPEDICLLSAAILHDVLEDTSLTEPELRQFLNTIMEPVNAEKTTRLVVELTDVFVKSAYPGMKRSERKQKEAARLGLISSEGQTIKYADIIDNSDVTAHEPDFARVYLRESRNFLEAMDKGHPQLRSKAFEVLERCMKSLRGIKTI